MWFVLVAIESRCLCFINRDYTTTCQACRRLLIRLDQYLCVTTILWRWVRSSALCRWGTMRLRTVFFRLRWWEWDHHRHITQKNLRTQNSTCQNFNRSTHRWWVCLYCYWVQSCQILKVSSDTNAGMVPTWLYVMSLSLSNKPTTKIIDWSFLCLWANIQNQQGIKYPTPPLYITKYLSDIHFKAQAHFQINYFTKRRFYLSINLIKRLCIFVTMFGGSSS